MRKSLLILVATILVFSGAALPSSVRADSTGIENVVGISKRTIRKLQRRAPTAAKPPPTVDFSKVCAKVSPLIHALMKNAYPGHIQRGDPRASGFAFVCGSDCPSKFPAAAYYSDGTQAFKLGFYGLWEGNGRPRAYCGTGGAKRCYVEKVIRESKQQGRDGKVYIDFGRGSCRSATPGKRNGNP